MLTKKDFVKVADALAKTRPLVNADKREQWELLREALCTVFKDDNPAFDKQRFIDATEK
jgi:hypothetical protein